MRSIDELIASLKPKPRTYCFDTVPGKPTVTLREVDADNPVWLLHRLRKEQGGETAPATPTTIAEVERQVAADALQIVEIYVDTVTVDGELLPPDDAIKLLIAIAVRCPVTVWSPFMEFIIKPADDMAVTPEEVAGEASGG